MNQKRNSAPEGQYQAGLTYAHFTRRLVSVTSDDIFTLHESDAITWRREEALASVTATLFLDLPAPSPELAAQWRAAAPSLSERVQAEFLSLKASAAAHALHAP